MASNNLPAVITEVTRVLKSDDMQSKVATLLPPSVNRDRFTEVTIEAIAQNPDVLEADRESLYRACVHAARRGLLPDKREGALVIYNTNVGTRDQPRWMKLVQFMPMVEGVIKEMAKADIKAYAVSVYENDLVSFWNDDEGQHVKHEPVVFGDRGKIVGVFAAAKTADGRPYVEPLSLEDVERIARRSKQCHIDKNTGVLNYGGTWKTDFDRMAQKSALHRLRKRLPITDEDALENLRDLDDETDFAPAGSETAQTTSETQNPQQALPAPEENQLKKVRTPRRSRVLEGVVATAKQSTAPVAQTSGDTQARSEASAEEQTRQGKVAGSTPAGSQPEEYSEDDIV